MVVTEYSEGLRIGIRRGNVDLVKTCLDELHDPQTHLLLVQSLAQSCIEEAWYLFGEFQSWPKVSKKDLVKIALRLTLVPKSKDAGVLPFLGLVYRTLSGRDHRVVDDELAQVQDRIADIRKNQNLTWTVEELRTRLFGEKLPTGFVPCDDYKKSAMVGILSYIAAGGSMLGHFKALSALVLFGKRHFSQEHIREIVKERVNVFVKGGVKPQKTSLPWYCYSPSTEVGKEAIHRLASAPTIKSIGLDEKSLVSMVNVLETRKTLLKDLRYEPMGQLSLAGPTDNVWWLDYMKAKLPGDMRPKEAVNLYKSTVAPMLQDSVKHVLSRR